MKSKSCELAAVAEVVVASVPGVVTETETGIVVTEIVVNAPVAEIVEETVVAETKGHQVLAPPVTDETLKVITDELNRSLTERKYN